MHPAIKTFTVAMGTDLGPAAALGYPCAALALQLREGRLCPTGRIPAGGLMGLYTAGDTTPPPDPADLCRRLAAMVCRSRSQGLLLELPEDDAGFVLAASLAPQLYHMGIDVYLPVSLAHAAPHARLILPSAVSGGTLDGMLDHFLSQYPSERLCLELVRTRHDFPMPSADPGGTLLSAAQFDELHTSAGQHFFSPELCANYFTYMEDGKSPHFILFDDAQTARRKLEKAQSRGLYAAFALYAEWGRDIPAIFA